MKLSTPLMRKLGLKYPFVSAPMFIISNKEMIVAAAEAGILGSMPSLNARTAEQLREDLAWIRARTDKAFGINITIGLTKPERVEADMALCIEFEVPVIITSYGNPTPLVKVAHDHKAIVFHDVISLAHGKKAVAAGVDAIIAVSAGAGGHAGRDRVLQRLRGTSSSRSTISIGTSWSPLLFVLPLLALFAVGCRS